MKTENEERKGTECVWYTQFFPVFNVFNVNTSARNFYWIDDVKLRAKIL